VSGAGFSICVWVEKLPMGPIGFEKRTAALGLAPDRRRQVPRLAGGVAVGGKSSHLVEIVLVELTDE